MPLPDENIGDDTGRAIRSLRNDPQSVELIEHSAEMLAAMMKTAFRSSGVAGTVVGAATLRRAADLLDEDARQTGGTNAG